MTLKDTKNCENSIQHARISYQHSLYIIHLDHNTFCLIFCPLG